MANFRIYRPGIYYQVDVSFPMVQLWNTTNLEGKSTGISECIKLIKEI
jgi:hypothetical protein